MKITDLLKLESIALNPEVSSKSEALDTLVDLMDKSGNLNDKAAYKKAVLARESLSTTGIGEGIAIPHAKTAAVSKPGLAAMVVKKGVDFESLDGEPANLFFLIAAPDGESDLHLEVLARLSRLLMNPDFKQSLLNASSKEEFLKLIDEAETEKMEAENEKIEVKEEEPKEMKITDLLNIKSIALNPAVSNKSEALDTLVDLMEKRGNLSDKEAYKKAVLARESLSTTGIGEGIAIPHAKTSAVAEPGLAAMVIKDGIDFESLDGEPAKLFFLIAAPEGEANLHLDVLARLSTMLMNPDFKDKLLNASSKEEFLKTIDEAESDKIEKENTKVESNGYQVLAVTACPTGIAHTYMAAESLENKAKEMGISIKVETNGSGGAKNILTKEDIDNCTAIIVAADKKVEMARFEGKKVIQCPVADGIYKTEKLLTDAVNGNAPIYHHDGGSDSEGANESGEKESVGRKIYKDLMNGVSHMLPFVIGGGILIALSFLWDSMFGFGAAAPSFGTQTPVSSTLNFIGNISFNLMVPVLAGYIAMSIGDRPALAVGFVGGMIAYLGDSGFIGGLVAGFLAGYIVVGLKKLFSYLPEALEGLKPTLLYPLFGILIAGVLLQVFIVPYVAIINEGLTTFLNSMGEGSRVVLGAVLGGMMAIDMGGPFNKAAYVFGTAALSTGDIVTMAAVMAGGMVPPLAIAISTTIFKHKFTERERKSGLTNFIMGLCFITEGAIPFAAADPARVIPSCVVGSAIAGGLSAFFNCGIRAPHGGLFVIGVVEHPLMYLVSIAIGSIVAACILGALRKKVD